MYTNQKETLALLNELENALNSTNREDNINKWKERLNNRQNIWDKLKKR